MPRTSVLDLQRNTHTHTQSRMGVSRLPRGINCTKYKHTHTQKTYDTFNIEHKHHPTFQAHFVSASALRILREAPGDTRVHTSATSATSTIVHCRKMVN